jgi:signal transduction histidine kinase
VTPPADSTVQDLNETVRCFGGVLRSVLRQEPAPPSQDSVEQAVRRAKQEWELTVDALPHVVCLLDSAGRVLRANRAIERWSLGTVEDARGKHFHDLLHPDCVDPECPVLTGVGLSRKRMQSERRRAYEFQLSDRALQRTVRVRVGRMLGSSEQLQAVSATCAVLVVQDVTALELAKTRLAKLNAELESRVEERTRELADANRELQNEISRCTIAEEQLRQRSAELSQLSASLMNTQEQERKRISRELHDSIGQSLTALKFGLERAVELDRQGSRQAVIEQLQKSIGSVQATMDDVRTVALDLRPSVLDDLGAASAVAWFCRNFSASYPGIKVVISNVTARDNEVPARLATAIFRSLQELLNNVARHSQATRVSVALRREPRRVVLEVGDNGIGLQGPLPEPSARGGHGTRNLRERAEMTGGTFELRSGSPRGVVASISWMLLPGEDSGSDEPAVGEEK